MSFQEKNPEPGKISDSARNYLKDILSQQEVWDSMQNDIERYQKTKGIIINMFKIFRPHVPNQIQLLINNEVTKMEDMFPTDQQEFDDFMSLVKIFSDQLAQNLDNEDRPEFAIPYKIAISLDEMLHNLDNTRSQENVSDFGRRLLACFYELEDRINKSNWQKVWE